MLQFSSVTQSCLALRPHGLQHTRPPCPSPTPGACSNSCPLSRWCHPTISSSVVLFSSCLQSFPASGSFPKSQFFGIRWPKYWNFSISPSNEYSGLISFRKFFLWYLSPNLPWICFFPLPHYNRLHKGRDSLLYPNSQKQCLVSNRHQTLYL